MKQILLNYLDISRYIYLIKSINHENYIITIRAYISNHYCLCPGLRENIGPG